MSDSVQPHRQQPTRLLYPWISRQEYWGGLPFPSPMHACMLSHFSRVRLYATLWTTDYQAPLSAGFFRQGYWSGLPFPSPPSQLHFSNNSVSLRTQQEKLLSVLPKTMKGPYTQFQLLSVTVTSSTAGPGIQWGIQNCTSGDPERALLLAPVPLGMVWKQLSPCRSLLGRSAHPWLQTKSRDLDLDYGTWKSPEAWPQFLFAIVQDQTSLSGDQSSNQSRRFSRKLAEPTPVHAAGNRPLKSKPTVDPEANPCPRTTLLNMVLNVIQCTKGPDKIHTHQKPL